MCSLSPRVHAANNYAEGHPRYSLLGLQTCPREELATQHRDLPTQRGERKRVRRFYSLAQRMLEGGGDLFTQEQESGKVRTFGHQAPRAPQLHRQPHTASQNRTTSRSQTAQLTNLTQCTARPRQTAPRTQPDLHSQPQPTNRTLPANPT